MKFEGYCIVQLRWDIEGFPQELERVKNLEKVRRFKKKRATTHRHFTLVMFFSFVFFLGGGGKKCLHYFEKDVPF